MLHICVVDVLVVCSPDQILTFLHMAGPVMMMMKIKIKMLMILTIVVMMVIVVMVIMMMINL